MKEKIAKINYEANTGRSWEVASANEIREEYAHADKILAIFPSLDGKVVKEECEDCVYQNSEGAIDCPLCNNTGTITRQATWEDMEIFWSKIWDVELPAEVLTTKSGGRLKVKK